MFINHHAITSTAMRQGEETVKKLRLASKDRKAERGAEETCGKVGGKRKGWVEKWVREEVGRKTYSADEANGYSQNGGATGRATVGGVRRQK